MKMQIVSAVSVASAAESHSSSGAKGKRGIGFLGTPGFYGDSYGVFQPYAMSSFYPTNSPWNGPLVSDLALGQIQLQAVHNVALQVSIKSSKYRSCLERFVASTISRAFFHSFWFQALRDPHPGTPSIAYSPEVLRAIQQAKEASHNVLVAQQRVVEAKEAAILQQKIAIAKEASAREAARRYGFKKTKKNITK